METFTLNSNIAQNYSFIVFDQIFKALVSRRHFKFKFKKNQI